MGRRRRRNEAGADLGANSNVFAPRIPTGPRTKPNSRTFLAEHLKLNDAQKASFKEFQDARTKAVETATTRLCATKPDLSTFEGRLGFHQAFLEDRLEAVKAENPKLIAFYNSLDAEQKTKFDKFREQMARREGR